MWGVKVRLALLLGTNCCSSQLMFNLIHLKVRTISLQTITPQFFNAIDFPAYTTSYLEYMAIGIMPGFS